MRVKLCMRKQPIPPEQPVSCMYRITEASTKDPRVTPPKKADCQTSAWDGCFLDQCPAVSTLNECFQDTGFFLCNMYIYMYIETFIFIAMT